MQFSFSRCDQIERFQTDACVIFLAEDKKKTVYPELPENIDINPLKTFLKLIKKPAVFGKLIPFTLNKKHPPYIRITCGLGDIKKITAEKYRRIGGKIQNELLRYEMKTVCLMLPDFRNNPVSVEGSVAAIVEGMELADFRFNKFNANRVKKNPPPELVSVKFIYCGQIRNFRKIVKKHKLYVEGTNFTRELVMDPANVLNPESFVNIARNESKKYRYRLKVHNEKDIKKLRMNALLAVGQGSKHKSYLLELKYSPANSKIKHGEPIVIVGKGITFDTGGISIKPSKGMWEMKEDMAGAGAVMGVFRILARLAPRVPVLGLIPLAENMPGGNAIRPGDIVKASNGKTIEILNTDAEGRLILADALSYASRFNPAAVIDLATLTGACVVALGSFCAGLFSNHSELAGRLSETGDISGERLWRMPLWKPHLDMVKGDITDVKNTGHPPGNAGSISAAAFLYNFIGKYPWAHIDIAGTAGRRCPNEYIKKGATGFGVRILSSLVENWTPLPKSDIILPD